MRTNQSVMDIKHYAELDDFFEIFNQLISELVIKIY